MLGLDQRRERRWARRRSEGRLADRPGGGNPVHGLMAAEVEAILALHDEWGEVDGSHRKLAHRGSYLGRVWVSPATVFWGTPGLCQFAVADDDPVTWAQPGGLRGRYSMRFQESMIAAVRDALSASAFVDIRLSPDLRAGEHRRRRRIPASRHVPQARLSPVPTPDRT